MAEYNLSSDLKNMPFSLEAEQSVIGSILIDSEKYNDVAQIILADDFFIDDYKDMYIAIGRLSMSGNSIDTVTLIEETLKISDRKGRNKDTITTDVLRIAEVVPIAANAAGYAKIIRDKSLLRSLLNACNNISNTVYSESGEASAVVELAERTILDITRKGTNKDFVHLRDLLLTESRRLESLEKLYSEGKTPETGKKTGFSGLDRTLVGMEAGDLVLVGARPGMGKTSFVLNIAANVAKLSQKTVAIFSLEMSNAQLAQRILSAEAMINSYELRSAKFADSKNAWKKIRNAMHYLNTCDIIIDDTTGITATAMDAKLRRVKNLGLIIIDYLQLMQSEKKTENRTNEVSDISRSLKLMAKRLGVPVICCSQLSRAVETRSTTDKRPQLSDLRESGSIEQDADVVIFLYRESYYKNQESESENAMNIAKIIVAKNRHGQTHDGIEVGWIGEYTKFVTRADENISQPLY